MKPRLLVYVGLPKAGTTSLASALLATGVVCMPGGKEPWVLASDLALAHPTRRTPAFKSFSDYRRALVAAHPALVRVDMSTNTLPSAAAVEHVTQLADTFDVRFLASFREPQSWIVSYYLHMRRDAHRHGQGEPAQTIAEAVARSFAMADAGTWSHHGLDPVDVDLHYAAWLRWRTLLTPWLDRFGRDRFLVATLEDVTAGWPVFRGVLGDHLGVSQDHLPRALPSENRAIHPSATVRALLRARRMLGRAGLEPLLRLVPRPPKDRILAAIGRAERHGRETDLPASVRKRLQRETWAERKAVAELRSTDLPLAPVWLRSERYET